jgi:hypothetical protein
VLTIPPPEWRSQLAQQLPFAPPYEPTYYVTLQRNAVLLDTKASVETEVIRATVAITPTLYSSEPGGGVVLHNYITINLDSAAFREFNTQMNELLLLLRRSDEISGGTREQLIAEMKAGMEILTSPKPDHKLIDFVSQATAFVHDRAAGVAIGAAAAVALAALGRLTGLW